MKNSFPIKNWVDLKDGLNIAECELGYSRFNRKAVILHGIGLKNLNTAPEKRDL